tara:strand:+ start:227 stop:745 length:519 start_codon:yes stop_codon:yes gene_type:complete
MTYKGAPLMSVKQDWGTPQSFFDYVENVFKIKFSLDACASAHNYKVEYYFSEEDNALEQSWYGTTWLNPPFGKGGKLQKQFIQKASNEAGLGNCYVYALIPARTDTRLFHDIIMKEASAVYFIKGRLNFEHDDRTPRGSATFPNMLVVFNGIRYPNGPHMDTLEPTKKERGF